MINTRRKIIEATDLGIGYSGAGKKITIMQNLNLSARTGELVALIGRNGSGKSTLLRTLVSLQPPLSGSILIDQKPAQSRGNPDVPRMVSFTSTEPLSVHNLRVREAVALGRFPYTNWIGSLSAEDERVVSEALDETDLLQLSERNIDNISDGERQRVLIARSLAQDTDLMVMDEPTAFLDLPSRFSIVSLLRKLTREKDKCVIYSTHDLDTALGEADAIWLMTDAGIEQGAPEDHILTGGLAKAFESPMLSFSQTTGSFSFMRPGIGDIALEADGIYKILTEKALRRCGYKLNPEAKTKIIVNSGNGISEWQLLSGSESRRYRTIYELVCHLPDEADR